MRDTGLEACVARVEDKGNQIIGGTGFVIGPSLAVTCAHVVEACGAGPGERVRLVFRAGGEPAEAEVLTDGWHSEADVAFLRLPEPPPEGVAPAVLTPSVGQEGVRVRAFGYPEVGQVEGLWGDGRLVGRVTEAGQTLLQLSSAQITAGFSGGPVWDARSGRVIGMVTQIAAPDRYARLQDVAFAVPVEKLQALCLEKVNLFPAKGVSQALRAAAPFQAPPLPEHFVPRPEVADVLKARLLANDVTAPGVLVVSAIHGLGGIGKSTLAAALAYEREVQEHFPDGILWVTLGLRPDILSLLSGWIQVLGDYDFHPTAVEAASTHLRSLLQDKAALLVVDDAWDPAHVLPFQVRGHRCQVVITTREALIAKAVGATLYDLDVMKPDQALMLLSKRLGRRLEKAERKQSLALAKAVGYLPLALELAAAQIADGVPWAELLADLEAEIARLEALDLPGAEDVVDEADRKRLSLLASFHLSLRRLPDTRQQDFAWLGVLPEDAILTPAMAATLFETDIRSARDILRYLRDKALLMAGAPLPDGSLTYRVHDLLHDLARRLLTTTPTPVQANDLPGLGLTLPVAQAVLIDRYKAQTRGGRWHNLPDDGYIHTRLTWHMEQAEQANAIHALLREENGEGQNAWYKTRDSLGQMAGYLADVARAWRLAEEVFGARLTSRIPVSPAQGRHKTQLREEKDDVLGLQCRYALITASFSNLAGNIPSALLATLVEKAVWTPIQGLAYARQVLDLLHRTMALIELLPHLQWPLKIEILQEVLTAISSIQQSNQKTEMLPSLITRLAQRGYPQEALEAAEVIQLSAQKAEALARLAPHLSEPILQQATAIAEAIQESDHRDRALSDIAPRWAQLGYWEKVFEMVQAVRWEPARLQTLVRLAPYLPKELLMEVLAFARTIELESARAETLAELAPQLPDVLKNQAMREALYAAQLIGDDYNRSAMLGELVSRLEGPLKDQALEAALESARRIKWINNRAQALARLVRHLGGDLREEIIRETLALARRVRNVRVRAEVLAVLVPCLSEAPLQQALVAARMIGDVENREQTLAQLVLQFAKLGCSRKALEATQAIEGKLTRAELLAALASYLAEPFKSEALKEALAAAQAIKQKDRHARTLVALIPCLAKHGCLQEALVAAQMIEDSRDRLEVLVELASHLPVSLRSQVIREAWQIAWAIEDEFEKASALASLAPYLTGSLVRKAIAVVQMTADSLGKYENLRKFILRLAELGNAKEALETARGLGRESARAQSLAELAPHLPEKFLQESVTIARKIGRRMEREKALAAIAPCLAERGCFEVAWTVAQQIEAESIWVKALLELGPHLANPQRADVFREVMAAAAMVRIEHERANILIKLVPYLSEQPRAQVVKEALSAAKAMRRTAEKVETLVALASFLPEPLKLETLQEAFAVAMEMRTAPSRAEVLTWLIPHLPESLKSEAIRESLVTVEKIRDANRRSKVLVELAAHLPEEFIQQGLAAVLGIDRTNRRVQALAKFSQRLVTVQPAILYPIWRETLHSLVTRPRQDLLADLRALAPVIVVLGGEEAVAETFRAIRDVGRWWP